MAEENLPTVELSEALNQLRKQFRTAELNFVVPPQLLGGGFWAENWSINLAPCHDILLPSRLVVRIAPDSDLAAWENTIQIGVAKQGYQTPQIYASDSAKNGHRAWCVMDFADGHPLLTGINVVRVFATLPRFAVTLSDTLAKAAADLHRLEIGPIEFDLDRLGFHPSGTDNLIDEYMTRIHELPDRSLRLAVENLAATRPDKRTRVICHGDLHPFNVLISDTSYVVLDWTTARIAEPEFDLAYTYILLANPPLDAPRSLRPAINWAGRRMANRFVASYLKRSTHQINFDAFAWYQSLQAFRILFDLADWRAKDTASTRRNHPWFIMEPALCKLVTRAQ